MLTLDLPGYDLVIYFSQSFHLLGLSSDLLFRGALFDGKCIHGVVNPSHKSASNTVHSLGIGHYYAIPSLSRARHIVTGCVIYRYSQTRCSTLRCVICLSFRSRALKAPVGSKQWLQLLSDEEFSYAGVHGFTRTMLFSLNWLQHEEMYRRCSCDMHAMTCLSFI